MRRAPKKISILEEYSNIMAEKMPGKFAEKDVQSLPDKDLYNIKDDRYERNISELAHPKPVSYGDTHDKINGLIENINERNDIMCNIVTKPVTGTVLYKKYANDLMLDLIQIANVLDLNDDEGLRILADECINEIKKEADWSVPQAGATGLTVGLGGAALAALLGAGAVATPIGLAAAGGAALWYIFQFKNNKSLGLHKDAETVINEIDDLKSDYTAGIDAEISEFQNDLRRLEKASSDFHNAVSKTSGYASAKVEDLISSEAQKAADLVALEAVKYEKILKSTSKLIGEASNDKDTSATGILGDIIRANSQKSESSTLGLLWQKTKDVFHEYVMPSDVQDVINSVAALKSSISQELANLSKLKNKIVTGAEKLAPKVEEMLATQVKPEKQKDDEEDSKWDKYLQTSFGK